MKNEISGMAEAIKALEDLDRRVSSLSGRSHASVQINGSGALAIAGLWVSALLMVIATAMAFVCWQKANHLSDENERLSDRVDMLEARTFAAETGIRQMRAKP